MKPGLPFDVLLNKDSKRKIQSSVAWKGEERLFGSDAFNLVRLHLDLVWVSGVGVCCGIKYFCTEHGIFILQRHANVQSRACLAIKQLRMIAVTSVHCSLLVAQSLNKSQVWRATTLYRALPIPFLVLQVSE